MTGLAVFKDKRGWSNKMQKDQKIADPGDG